MDAKMRGGGIDGDDKGKTEAVQSVEKGDRVT